MTTRKRDSHDKARRAGSQPNLGQKAAEREKKSKTQLSHMEGRRPTSAPGRFVAWCKQEQASIQQQLDTERQGVDRREPGIRLGRYHRRIGEARQADSRS